MHKLQFRANDPPEPTAVSAVANGSDNRIATFSSSDALNGEANLTFDGSTLVLTGSITCSVDLDIEGDIDMATGKRITWVDDNTYISGTATGITIETDDTLVVNCDTSSTFNAPTSIFQHTANADLTIKSSNTSKHRA